MICLLISRISTKPRNIMSANTILYMYLLRKTSELLLFRLFWQMSCLQRKMNTMLIINAMHNYIYPSLDSDKKNNFPTFFKTLPTLSVSWWGSMIQLNGLDDIGRSAYMHGWACCWMMMCWDSLYSGNTQKTKAASVLKSDLVSKLKYNLFLF